MDVRIENTSHRHKTRNNHNNREERVPTCFQLNNVLLVKKGSLCMNPRNVANSMGAVEESGKYSKRVYRTSRKHSTLHQKSVLRLKAFPSVLMLDHQILKIINFVYSVSLSTLRPHPFVTRRTSLRIFSWCFNATFCL